MKRAAIAIGIVLVVVLGVAAALPFLIDGNQFRPELERRLSAALGREVTIGDLKISLFSGGASATDVSIADDPAFSRSPFLRAHSLSVGVELLPLIESRKLNVTGINIEQPDIALIESAAGVFNFTSMGGKPGGAGAAGAEGVPAGGGTKALDLSVASLKITGGRISLTKMGDTTKPIVLEKLNIEAKNFSPAAPFPFSLSAEVAGGGSIKLDGTSGRLNEGDIEKTPFNAKLQVNKLDLVGSGLASPASGLAGVVTIDGSAASAGGTIDVTAKMTAENLVVSKGGSPAAQPVTVDLAMAHNLAGESGQVRDMAIRAGAAVAHLTGSYRLNTEPATVNLQLKGSAMPLKDLAALLPPLNVRLPKGASIDQGTADVSLASQGTLDRLVTTGRVGAQNARLANYDFASKLQVLRDFTGIKAQPHTTVQTLTADVRNTVDGTALDNIHFAIASIGAMEGSGTISPANALNFKMRAAIGGGALASLGGAGGIPFTIQGTAENPVVRPDVQGIVTNELKGVLGGKTDAGKAAGILKGLFGDKKK